MNAPTTEKRDIDILDLLAALNAGKRLIAGGTIIICILAGALSLLLPNEYEGVVQLLPPKEQKQGFGFADLLSDLPIPSLRLGEKGTPADIFVAILKSPTLGRRMVARFDLVSRYEVESLGDAVEALEKRTEVGKSEQGTIMISVLDRDPQVAAAMANQYVLYLDTTNQHLSRTSASERLDFLGELEHTQSVKLQDYMLALQKFQEQHNAISLEDQARASIRAAADMQMAAMELVIKKLSLLRSGFSPTHPEVKRLEQEAIMREEMLSFLRDGADSTAGRDGEFGSGALLKENLFLPLRRIPAVAQEYANIEKDVLVQAALMKLLLEQKAEALIEASNTTSTVQLLDAATPPEKPAKPQRLLIVLIAGVLSLFASTFYVLGSTYVRLLRDRWRAEYAN
ncbi:MAG: GNVR domain-containing protein [Gemmatimonadota bacterium]